MVLQAARQCTYNYNKHVNVNLIQLRRTTSTPPTVVLEMLPISEVSRLASMAGVVGVASE